MALVPLELVKEGNRLDLWALVDTGKDLAEVVRIVGIQVVAACLSIIGLAIVTEAVAFGSSWLLVLALPAAWATLAELTMRVAVVGAVGC